MVLLVLWATRQTFLPVAVVISTASNVSPRPLHRKKPAMGGENAESPVAVTEGCPAFADGCPYGKNVEVADWIKARDAGSSHMSQLLSHGW